MKYFDLHVMQSDNLYFGKWRKISQAVTFTLIRPNSVV